MVSAKDITYICCFLLIKLWPIFYYVMLCVLLCSHGNLLLLSQALCAHETFFIHYRIYLILEKLKMIVYRNLFKKV